MKNLFTKKASLILVFTISFISLSSQVFWTENFGTASANGDKGINAKGYNSTNGVYSLTDVGVNGSYPNIWYVSSIEAGMGAGNCSKGYLQDNTLTNKTLHLSRQPYLKGQSSIETLGDFGAVYSRNENTETDCRIETPFINCTSKANILINFDYFLGSLDGTDDSFSLYYYDGSNWSLINTFGPTQIGNCNSGKQGLWKNSDYYILPSSANNNPNVKIGFRWKNETSSSNVVTTNSQPIDSLKTNSGSGYSSSTANPDTISNNAQPIDSLKTNSGNGSGSSANSQDTTSNNFGSQATLGQQNVGTQTISFHSLISVAIDNITISGSAYVDPNNSGLKTSNNNSKIDIKTVSDKKNNPTIVFTTYSEKFPANDLVIESSTDGTDFNELNKIKSKAVKGSVAKLEYNFTDAQANDGVNYYRIKQINADKTTVISKIVSVDYIKAKNITFTVYPNPNSGQFTVDFSGIENNHEVQIVLNDMNDGHEIYSTTFFSNSIDSNKMDVNPPTKIAPGRYICSLIFEGIRSSVIVMIN